jgi:hypothetical protein
MRRVRWLAAGAVMGIVGYRRLAHAVRSATERRPEVQVHAVRGLWRVAAPTARIAGIRRRLGIRAFVRDVRAGMAEYAGQDPAVLARGGDPPEPPGYIDRRPGRSRNTLVGQVAAGAKRPSGPARALGAGQGGSSAMARPARSSRRRERAGSRSDNAGSDNQKDGR